MLNITLFNCHGKLLLKRRHGDIDVMPIVTSINDLIMVTYVLDDVVLGSLAYNGSRDCSDCSGYMLCHTA